MYPFERSFELSEARRAVEKLLAKQGLSWRLVVAGRNVHATKCTLLDSRGRRVASGLGKGDEESSIVGALFEAAEHFYTDFEKLDSRQVFYIRNRDFTSDNRALSAVLRAIIATATESQLPCLFYTSLRGDGGTYYPVGLSIPSYVDGLLLGGVRNHQDSFDYCRLALYSTNSGAAIGMNRSESIVHGLLESIERDAISRFLVRAFLLRDSSAVRRVVLESLPHQLRRLAARVESETDCAVMIYELPNRYGIPTHCAWIGRSLHGIYPHGFGCSLSRYHAVERSLYEAAQYYVSTTQLHTREAVRRSKIMRRTFKSLPVHRRCAEFDLRDVEKSAGVTQVLYDEGADKNFGNDVEEYLGLIAKRVTAQGEAAFSATLATAQSGITITHNFTSAQDVFFAVLNGAPVVPSSLAEMISHDERRASMRSATVDEPSLSRSRKYTPVSGANRAQFERS